MTDKEIDELRKHISRLTNEFCDLKKRLEGFKPVIVDLRINGVVRPVILFALDANFEMKPSMFKIVSHESNVF